MKFLISLYALKTFDLKSDMLPGMAIDIEKQASLQFCASNIIYPIR